MRKVTFVLLFTLMAAMTTFGGGYQVGLHSIRNIGMGLIGTSLTYDASSLFYNPGGASFVNEKFSISGGVSFLMSRATFQAKNEAYQEHIDHVMNYPFNFYFAYKPIKDLSVGVAVNTPYGLSMSWPDKWEGRYLIQNIAFKAITIQPTVSYKIKDIIGIGAGLIISYGDVNLKRAIPVNGPDSADGQLTVKGTTIKYGFNAGILIHPIKGLNIGVDYRSKIDMSIKDGDATFAVPTAVASKFPYTKTDVSLPLPANLDFGISYEINEKIMIGLGLNYVFWSTYDSLKFTFKSPDPNVTLVSTSPKLYKDRLIARLGVQWKISGMFTVRAGGYYDPSPVPSDYLDPMLPSSNETALTCGISLYPVKGLSIDASFEYLMGSQRDGISSPNVTPGTHNFEGTYSTAFYMPGIGLTYNF
ncbi:MAG: outer membrane protein transport protein [Bacteroidetes bacterium]|nr:outer membrane protein transport protein [Bacteroidota bacterium]